MAEEETVKEEAKPESESAIEVPKLSELPSAVLEVKESNAELNVMIVNV